jgi:23S rRNA (uracil1939-C5)-methyltransferase
MIRTASTGQIMVLVIFAHESEKIIQPMMQAMAKAFPQITSLQYIVNTKKNDAFQDLEASCFSGKPFVEEKMENLTFRIGPTSFYQTNGPQALAMYQLVEKLAKPGPEDLVYDLYTGTGTIAQFLARKAKHVVGIEYVPAAVADARENARLNKLSHTTFVAGDMAKVLSEEFVASHGKPDIMIVDPPRAGMHVDVVQQILKIGPRKLVYVSCNPATQARDLSMLSELYETLEIHPLDMFPHTHHVENVALLRLK